MLPAEDEAVCLDPAHIDPDMLRSFFLPADPATMVAFAVCRAVNSSRNESPDLIAPV